jgi:hypothetical protein
VLLDRLAVNASRPIGKDDEQIVESHYSIFDQVFWAAGTDTPHTKHLHQIGEANDAVAINITRNGN